MTDRSTTPAITVVIPTRDRQTKIIRCIESLTHQRYKDFEVIVVNDGSTDQTQEALSDLACNNPHLNLRVLHNEAPRGANPSRNEAIRVGRGELFAFIDDDCIAESLWLEMLLNPLKHEAVAAVSGHVENIALSNLWERFFIGQHRVSSREVAGIRVASRLVAGNLLVRKEFLANALDEDRADVPVDVTTSARGDEEGLRIKILRAGKLIAHSPEAVCLHDHPYGFRSFCRQAFKSGQATARLALKYRLSPRWELLALLAAFVFAMLSLWKREAAILSSISYGLFLVAVLYNELVLKSKTIRQTSQTLPALLLYYSLRAAGYVTNYALRSRL